MGKLKDLWVKHLVAKDHEEDVEKPKEDRWQSLKDIWHTTFSRANVGDNFDQYQDILGTPDATVPTGDIQTVKYYYHEYKENADPVTHKMEFDLRANVIIAKRSQNV